MVYSRSCRLFCQGCTCRKYIYLYTSKYIDRSWKWDLICLPEVREVFDGNSLGELCSLISHQPKALVAVVVFTHKVIAVISSVVTRQDAIFLGRRLRANKETTAGEGGTVCLATWTQITYSIDITSLTNFSIPVLSSVFFCCLNRPTNAGEFPTKKCLTPSSSERAQLLLSRRARTGSDDERETEAAAVKLNQDLE